MVGKVVILTGAGVSAESGIQTFRAADGLWHNHRIEDVASPEGFSRNPAMVHQFYNERRRNLLSVDIRENAAHVALAELEKRFNGEVLLVTQNIDDLHERAGSQQLVHMHGELLKKRCNNCGVITHVREDITTDSVCQQCNREAQLRPHIVWFGEMPLHMPRIEKALRECDLFVSIGTSGNVYPAAGFVQLASSTGADTLELNLEASATNSLFNSSRLGPATELVPAWVDEVVG
jgi:NAD-dependent deacetylase